MASAAFHKAVLQQGQVELTVLFAIGRGLGHEQVDDIQAKTEPAVGSLLALNAMQAPLPTQRQFGGRRIDALCVVSKVVWNWEPSPKAPSISSDFPSAARG
jgi:hypothetical protein